MPKAIPYYRAHGPRVDQPNRHEKGYDAAWYRLRARFVRDWFATKGPYCGLCHRVLVESKRTHVDHVIPFDGVDDPKRLDPRNLRVLCDSCNAKERWNDRRS
jgi:5-methylcytosine-specific restriction endonuclease McrA